MRKKELAKAEQALAKAQAKLAEFDAIHAILDPYQRANAKLTVDEVIPLLRRDGRPEDAEQGVQEFRRLPKATMKAKPRGVRRRASRTDRTPAGIKTSGMPNGERCLAAGSS